MTGQDTGPASGGPGGRGPDRGRPPGPRDRPGPAPSRRTREIYFLMMGVCIGLFVISWAVVDRYTTLGAVILSLVALVIPPVAAIIANWASATDRRG